MANTMSGSVFATSPTDKTAPSRAGMAPNQFALVNKIRELFPRDTVKALAAWLKVSTDTARHRIKGDREFSLDEVSALLQSEHGYKILEALMTQAKRKPRWWLVCEPLMELADLEVMATEARKRARNVMHKREEVIDALEAEIRRAQALAIHGQAQAGVHADALLAQARVVAPKRRR